MFKTMLPLSKEELDRIRLWYKWAYGIMGKGMEIDTKLYRKICEALKQI